MIIALTASLLALAFVTYFSSQIMKESSGTSRMKRISDAIKEGSMAYLKRQYTTLAIFVSALTIILAIVFGYKLAFAYLIGSIFSVLAGFIGMNVAIRANVRTANAARKSLKKALPIAFKGGAVMGFCVVGLGLLGIIIFYYLYGDPSLVLGFSFGASSVALFARVGGGIYTKTADVGADLVGKVEKGIPEDDPRNPAVIADNVGDNVGDVAGMGADLFESYVGSIVAAMIIGTIIFRDNIGIVLPLALASFGIFASLIGTFFVRVKGRGDPSSTLNKGTFSSCILFALFSFLLIQYLNASIGIFYAVLSGLIAGVIIGLTSDYFTSREKKPTRKIAESAKTGAAITILTGFSTGLLTTVLPIIGIAIATIVAWYFAGIFGIAVSAIGMLSITGMVVAADSYGPIVDNAGGIVEQSKLGERVRKVTDSLDSVGNTTKAICKGFAIGSAALTALALFFTYSQVAGIKTIDIMNPFVIAGIFIGAAIPTLFCALTISAVGKNAFRMVEEVRRQFREIPGLIKGRARPEYARCVDIAAKGALKELMLPGILAIIVPLAVGFLLGKEALAGLLAGSIVTGLIFALLMANAGAAWDNAKKYIEAGNFGGKGSEAHKAAVVGDTVGDPMKDTAGPSLNILIKLMSIVALVFAPMIVKYALL
jgi:K(+)-stimulated pyrophosphate-energized sodium pump